MGRGNSGEVLTNPRVRKVNVQKLEVRDLKSLPRAYQTITSYLADQGWSQQEISDSYVLNFIYNSVKEDVKNSKKEGQIETDHIIGRQEELYSKLIRDLEKEAEADSLEKETSSTRQKCYDELVAGIYLLGERESIMDLWAQELMEEINDGIADARKEGVPYPFAGVVAENRSTTDMEATSWQAFQELSGFSFEDPTHEEYGLYGDFPETFLVKENTLVAVPNKEPEPYRDEQGQAFNPYEIDLDQLEGIIRSKAPDRPTLASIWRERLRREEPEAYRQYLKNTDKDF